MRRKIVPITIGILILCVMAFVQSTQISFITRMKDRLENLLYDEVLIHSEGASKTTAPSIVIVDVDEKSIAQIGRWPWPRRNMIDLIKTIQSDGAALIAFDMVFSENDVSPVDALRQIANNNGGLDAQKLDLLKPFQDLIPGDRDFAKILSQSDVVLGFVIHNNEIDPSRGVLPTPMLALDAKQNYAFDNFSRYLANVGEIAEASKSAGFLTALPDDDGLIRRAPLVLKMGDQLFPSLALEAARLYLLYDKVDIEWSSADNYNQVSKFQLGEQEIRTDKKGQYLIPFRAGAGQYRYESASDILSGKVPKGTFQNALVFVGSSSFRFGDLHAVPRYPTFPGVEIQATIADSIIQGRTLYTPQWSNSLELILTIALGLFLAFLLPFLGTLGTVLVTVGVLSSLLGAYYYLFTEHGIVFAVTGLMAHVLVNSTFNLGYGLVAEGSRRKNLKNLFGQYVPKEHVEQMSEHPEQYSGEGRSQKLTVMFSDIIGFTTVVEKLSAPEIRSLLNLFFTPMTKIIFQNQGTVDKYVGDMVMAFWGAPIPDDKHAAHALNAALQMRAELKNLKERFAAHGLPPIEIGIGINTGEMFVGDMGSEFRRAYTVLGDAVNVASRIESLNRYYGIHIAVGEETVKGQVDFAFRLIDRVRVVGRQVPLELYELCGYASEITPEQKQEFELHKEALTLYFVRDFKNAAWKFNELHNLYPQSKLYKLFVSRIEELSQANLGEDWDGAYQWLSK